MSSRDAHCSLYSQLTYAVCKLPHSPAHIDAEARPDHKHCRPAYTTSKGPTKDGTANYFEHMLTNQSLVLGSVSTKLSIFALKPFAAILNSLSFYCITVRFVVFDYRTCLGLGYCRPIYLAIQLFSCKYVTIKLSWVKPLTSRNRLSH